MSASAVAPNSDLVDAFLDQVAQRMSARGSKEIGFKHDAVGGTPSQTGMLHGPQGLLTYPGVDPDVFHTIVGTLPGLMSAIPTRGTLYTDPTYEVLTGIQAGSGTEPAEVCDAAPTGGLMKAGIITAPLGRYQRQTREIDIGRLGQRTDRADPVDLRLVGSPMGQPLFGAFDDNQLPNDIVLREMAAVMMERAVEFHRLLSRQIFQGNPTNSTGPGNRQFVGLDLLINTGYVDAITPGVPLPSLDPDIKDFGYVRVDSEQGMNSIIDQITYIVRTRRDLARRTGVDPVRWAFVMREGLFYELTKVWPCAYMTSICAVDASSSGFTFNIDQGDQIRMRDDMRAGNYLLIDGTRYDVILDDGIIEETNTTSANVTSGCFASDIYFVPLSILGGSRAVTFFEYFQWQNPDINAALARGFSGVRAFGPFLECESRTRWCINWQARIEPRLVLRTPWLSGRLTNVQYCPLQHTRDPFPDDPYFVNGGLEGRPGPSYTTPW